MNVAVKFLRHEVGPLGPALVFEDTLTGVCLAGTLEYPNFDGEKYWEAVYGCFVNQRRRYEKTKEAL